MMPGINTEIQSAGGGYGGFGGDGFGSNPLLWLITLGFLGRNGGLLNGGGDCAATAGIARNSEGISCLAQGQSNIIQQQQFDRLSSQQSVSEGKIVSALGDVTAELNNMNRDLATALCDGFNNTQIRAMQSSFDLSRQIADCCCENQKGIQAINTAIAMQTNDLVAASNANARAILDTINANKIQELQTELGDAKTRIALAEQTTALITACGCCPGGSSATMSR